MDIFRLSDRISLVPVIHGSGDCTIAVRRIMLEHEYDCLVVPLPPSFQQHVEEGIDDLPEISAVVQYPAAYRDPSWKPTWDDEDHDLPVLSYVPIDPCQPVVSAIRIAIGEHIPRIYADEESDEYVPHALVTPDPYAIKRITLDRFAAALLPSLPRPTQPQVVSRISTMAGRLRACEQQFSRILFVCSFADWPWIREAYQSQPGSQQSADRAIEDVEPCETRRHRPFGHTLMFLLGELPYITQLYVRSQRQLDDDTNLSIDGIKELLLAARTAYRREFRRRARSISPQALALCLKYVRNLTLLDRRLTPDLFNIVTAAKQVLGDGLAIHVAEQAQAYGYQWNDGSADLHMGVDRARLPNGSIVGMVSRLPGPPVSWRTIALNRRPPHALRQRWQMQWNPFSQCSWPPEDDRIEQFRTHVVDRARAILGADLARHEKFTCSIKDGIDIRETLRNWHTGELYVKVLPPARGPLDTVVMLFDSPADPRDYPWRTTWFAEHSHESTLAFFATDFHQEMVGPGIGLAQYGGAMFLFPPQPIRDIWHEQRLDFTETLEERLLAAACLYSQSRHVALLSPLPPGAGWRRLAKRFGKKLVHLPLTNFGQSTIAQLRMVHVLNGHEVRSYAANFIRHA